MRNVVLVAIVAWAAATSWAQSNKNAPEAKSETLLRWSFAGTKSLAANNDLKVFNAIRALPESALLRDAAATNLARITAGRFMSMGNTNKAQLPAGATEAIATLIQPLVADLVQNESRFQMDTQGAQDADWFLAVKIPEARASEWSKSLAQLASLSTMKGAVAGKTTWLATRENYKLSFSRAKDWTIIQGGYGDPGSKNAKAFRDSLSKRRGDTLLDADLNAPLLAKIWSAPQLAHYPKLSLRAEPRKDGIFSELILDYPQDLGIKHEKWNVPAELIKEPIIGFTAIQGIQKKLESWEHFKALGAKQTPNQLFLWAQDLGPFTLTAAAEVKNPAEVVTNAFRAYDKIPLRTGDIQLAKNRVATLWLGLPVVIPYLSVPEPQGSFITAGLFPFTQHEPKPVPAELLDQLKKKNLVYYDWEITGKRIEQWIPVWQLHYLVNTPLAPDSTAPSGKFLNALRGQIGNTVTSGTLENSKRIKFTRQSHLGASALELVLLAHYLDPVDVRVLNSPAKSPGVPAPAAK